MLATLASQIPILAPASPPLGSGFFDLTPFDQKTGHSSLRVYQDPQKLILLHCMHKQQDFFGCLAEILGCLGLREAANLEI